MFSFFSQTNHLNYKISFIGSIITQQYANQIHNLEENLKVNQLPMRVAYQQILKQLLLEMHHITISRNTYGPHLKSKWDSIVLKKWDYEMSWAWKDRVGVFWNCMFFFAPLAKIWFYLIQEQKCQIYDMNRMQQRNDDEKSIFQRHISVSLQFIKENYWHCIMQMSFSDINATLCYSVFQWICNFLIAW